jgi:hypothetical protein
LATGGRAAHRRRRFALAPHLLERGAHLGGRREARARSFSIARAITRSSAERHVGVQLHRRRRLAVEDGVEHHGRRGAMERLLAGGHLVEHEAEREQVRARVELFAARLLGDM